MTAGQFDLVYNASSFTMASMMASTIFFWLRVGSINEKYKSALVITGLVTFIAAYHYFRIFNSWVEAYSFPAAVDGVVQDPVITGKPFNDAYRYMDWLLTVPLLLIEIVFVMNLSAAETASKAWTLGVSSALMIILGYPGELIMEGDLSGRWMYWTLSMIPFLYVVYTLLVGLKGAIASEVHSPRPRPPPKEVQSRCQSRIARSPACRCALVVNAISVTPSARPPAHTLAERPCASFVRATLSLLRC